MSEVDRPAGTRGPEDVPEPTVRITRHRTDPTGRDPGAGDPAAPGDHGMGPDPVGSGAGASGGLPASGAPTADTAGGPAWGTPSGTAPTPEWGSPTTGTPAGSSASGSSAPYAPGSSTSGSSAPYAPGGSAPSSPYAPAGSGSTDPWGSPSGSEPWGSPGAPADPSPQWGSPASSTPPPPARFSNRSGGRSGRGPVWLVVAVVAFFVFGLPRACSSVDDSSGLLDGSSDSGWDQDWATAWPEADTSDVLSTAGLQAALDALSSEMDTSRVQSLVLSAGTATARPESDGGTPATVYTAADQSTSSDGPDLPATDPDLCFDLSDVDAWTVSNLVDQWRTEAQGSGDPTVRIEYAFPDSIEPLVRVEGGEGVKATGLWAQLDGTVVRTDVPVADKTVSAISREPAGSGGLRKAADLARKAAGDTWHQAVVLTADDAGLRLDAQDASTTRRLLCSHERTWTCGKARQILSSDASTFDAADLDLKALADLAEKAPDLLGVTSSGDGLLLRVESSTGGGTTYVHVTLGRGAGQAGLWAGADGTVLRTDPALV